MTKITLRVIADETGLSKFAVSRALAGKTGVSEATRARVVETAARLGYAKPAPAKRATIGVVFDKHDQSNGDLNVQIQNGLQGEARRLGYLIRAHWSGDGEDLAGFLADCDALFAVNLSNAADLERIRAFPKPLIRTGGYDPLESVDIVGGTDHEAGIAVARYLHGLGHREIVYVHGDLDLRGRRVRLQGVLDVVNATPGLVCHDVTWEADGNFGDRLDRIVAQGAQPTAFFCAHDGLALAAYTALLSRGVRIPQDASVVGFGDFSAARQVSPALTTVKILGEEFGRAAVRQLDSRLREEGPRALPMRILIPHVFVERLSTGPARVGGSAALSYIREASG